MHRQIAGSLTGPVVKWIVLGVWLVLAVGGGMLSGKLTDVQNNEASSWLPASAESTKALEKLAPFQDPNTIPTTVVYESDSVTGAALAEVAAGDAAAFAELDGVVGEPIPTPTSKDGEAAQVIVQFNLGDDGWNKMPDVADQLRGIADHDGVETHIAGPGGQAADSAEAFAGIDSTLLLAALGVVIVILLFVYRSPVLWVLPILSVFGSLAASFGLVYLLAKYAGLTVNAQSQAILSILVIGAGTDYALLLVARYREELGRHQDRHEAMAFALHRAAPAILASAATVALSMVCLLLAEMESTAGLGPVVAVGIVATYLAMATLLPALLVICGRWVFWPKKPEFSSDEQTQDGLWAKVGARISRRPRQVWALTTVLLAICCLGLFRLDATGLAADQQYTEKFDSIIGQEVLVEHGLADESNTVMVVANADRIEAVAEAMTGIDGLAAPGQPSPAVGGVALVEAAIFPDGSSPEAFDVVREVRAEVHQVDGADALVGGGSAFYLDTLDASTRDSFVIIPVVLLVVLLVLMVLLRAVVAPLLLLGTVVLSFGSALGISVVLFEYVFGFAGQDPSFPLFSFVFLVALGIDYNIFLMTRVREESAHRGTRQGALTGLTTTGGVITSAGIVLAATFLVLGSLPVVFLVELGVAVAIGVILDTMVVRSVLVTALILDFGKIVWWPGNPESAALAHRSERGQAASALGVKD